MDKRSVAAIVLLLVVGGGGLYYMHVSYEAKLAEAQKMISSAEAAAKRAQEMLKQQR